MADYKALDSMVVDRAGFALPSNSNAIQLANRPFNATAMRRVPLDLANLNGPMRDANLTPGLTTTNGEVR